VRTSTAVPQLLLSSSGPCRQHVLQICACKVIWNGTYLTTWKKSRTLTVILTGKRHGSERASSSPRKPGLQRVGKAVKGRTGSKWKPSCRRGCTASSCDPEQMCHKQQSQGQCHRCLPAPKKPSHFVFLIFCLLIHTLNSRLTKAGGLPALRGKEQLSI